MMFVISLQGFVVTSGTARPPSSTQQAGSVTILIALKTSSSAIAGQPGVQGAPS